MLVLSKSQAKNYFKKLQPSYNNEGCGCCYNSVNYRIDKNKILSESYGEIRGNSYFIVTVIAKIKGARSNYSDISNNLLG